MLTPIKNYMENPQDIPNVPRATMEYLQVQY
ncbi:phage protein, partial [Klebsiella pneumoniae]